MQNFIRRQSLAPKVARDFVAPTGPAGGSSARVRRHTAPDVRALIPTRSTGDDPDLARHLRTCNPSLAPPSWIHEPPIACSRANDYNDHTSALERCPPTYLRLLRLQFENHTRTCVPEKPILTTETKKSRDGTRV